MPPRVASNTKQLADEVSGGERGVIKGPLKGYHHETYVLRLDGGTQIVKVREPRSEILWFDRRCFESEEKLLRTLKGKVDRIPEVLDVAGMGFQGFIEGRTLPTRRWAGRRVSDQVFDQIVELFRQMAEIRPDLLERVPRRCLQKDRADDRDTDGFLERLIVFIEDQVYEKNLAEFGDLFDQLGVRGESFTRLKKKMSGLRRRPFGLLHADLHRKNFVVDSRGQLWTIDWELAMLGDPLYDLATHLYLMRYPEDQQRRMAAEWSRVVEKANPGGSYGLVEDLDVLLDFKRAQSVFTDVIRVSMSLGDGTGFNWAVLPWAARKLQRVLAAAAGPLELAEVPSHTEIMTALMRRRRAADAGHPG
ncbi:aminoglycoside phosphotransferase family protein [Streptomyces sp. TLI_185]|uniref:aminoglycoside phosphotransferase family protein n=1 Tax=Streptomyces sp. TLI_185 TaxID=2485151 RepID=UPI000F50D5C3|nr:aminoglycoside phosphotransferase family protein [Streptomyces sp. TLI_185]RPF34523.1 phosphotransferase family enzyme [Streptomyces sp. TLI_185]